MNQGSKKPGPDSADAWSKLQRQASAALRGLNDDHEELGDTTRTMGAAVQATVEEAPNNEILTLVTDSLAAAPERADLWMMRFEVQKTLGMKTEFAAALVEGWNNPRLSRHLDWKLVHEMWDVLAPGEPAPDGIKLPSVEPSPATAAPMRATPNDASRKRRFSDIALTLAARELTILSKAYGALHSRPGFHDVFAKKLAPMISRPTPLQFAEKLTHLWGGNARIFLKREDQRRVTPEAENAIAQAYIGQQLGKWALITGNDIDAHSLGLAIAAQRFGMKCTVAVRPHELEQKKEFIGRLRTLGAAIETPSDPRRDSDDPRVTALLLWQQSKGQAHLALSLGWGPGPYPTMVNDFQSLLGREVEAQLHATAASGSPRTLVASVGSEADAIGFMLPELNNPDTELMYAEPDPGGPASWRPSTRLRFYKGARREHTWLHATNRITHVAVSDSQARSMQQQASSLEKIQLSLEDARALALTALLTQRNADPRNYVILTG